MAPSTAPSSRLSPHTHALIQVWRDARFTPPPPVDLTLHFSSMEQQQHKTTRSSSPQIRIFRPLPFVPKAKIYPPPHSRSRSGKITFSGLFSAYVVISLFRKREGGGGRSRFLHPPPPLELGAIECDKRALAAAGQWMGSARDISPMKHVGHARAWPPPPVQEEVITVHIYPPTNAATHTPGSLPVFFFLKKTCANEGQQDRNLASSEFLCFLSTAD